VLIHQLEFQPAQDADAFAAVPASAAVFPCAAKQLEPYVTKTANLRRRLQRLLSVPGNAPSA
jgi:hypothetical protein